MPNLFFIKDIKKSNSSCNSFSGKKKYIATADLQNGKIVNYEVVEFNSKPSRANLIADNGSVIFAKMQNTIKVLEIDDSNVDNIYSTGFYSFKDERILPSYMKFFFESTLFNTIKDKNCQGATMKAINDDGMSKISINVPSIQIQQKIIAELSKITELINFHKNNLVNLDNIVKSQFIEMFGDPVKNTYGWNTDYMKNQCHSIGDGLHGTPEYDDEGEYFFINGNNLDDKQIIIKNDTKRVSKATFEKHYIKLDDNTILLSINGTLGKTGFYNNEPVILGKSACYCNLKNNLNKNFVIELFNTNFWKQYMIDNSSGTTIVNFGLKAMREYKVILPPIELQNKFANFVQQIDKSKYFGGVGYGIC